MRRTRQSAKATALSKYREISSGDESEHQQEASNEIASKKHKTTRTIAPKEICDKKSPSGSSSEDLSNVTSQSNGKKVNEDDAFKPDSEEEEDDTADDTPSDSDSSSFEPIVKKKSAQTKRPPRKSKAKPKINVSANLSLASKFKAQPLSGIQKVKSKVTKNTDDGSSSDSSSSDEFQRVKPSESINFTSEYFTVPASLPVPKEESINDFSAVESNILNGVTSTLSGSESEAEYTEVNWNFLPGTSTDLKSEKEIDSVKEKKPSSRSKKKGKEISKKALNVLQLLELGEAASTEPEIVPKVEHSEDDLTDLEEVDFGAELEEEKPKFPVIPKEGVQITLDAPELHKKRKQKDFDMKAYLLRRLNNRLRSIQILIHKVHLLTWIAHGHFVNSVLNSEELLGLCLSLIPSQHCYPPKRADLAYLENFLGWFNKTIPLKDKNKIATYPEDLTESLLNQVTAKAANSKRDLVLIFICVLRSLGIKVRLVLSLQPAPLKLASHEVCTVLPTQVLAKQKKEKEAKLKTEKTEQESNTTPSKSKEKSGHKTPPTSRVKEEVLKSPYFESNKETAKDKKNDAKNKITKSKSDRTNNSKKAKQKDDSTLKRNQSIKRTNSDSSTSSKYFKTSEDSSQTPNPEPSTSKRRATKRESISKSNKKIAEVQERTKKVTAPKTLPKRQSKTKIKSLAVDDSESNSDFEPKPKRAKSKYTSPEKNSKSKASNKRSRPTAKRARTVSSTQSKRKSLTVDDAYSDSDFEPEKTKESDESDSESALSREKKTASAKKPLRKWSGKVDRRVLSSESDEDGAKKKKGKTVKQEKKIGIDVWAEVFLEAEEKWFSVDVPLKKVHCYKELHAKATQPVYYVVGFNPDLSLKDVTRRYVVNWTTIKQRVDEVWWEKALAAFLGKKTPQDLEEDEELSDQMLNHPLPAVIGEYKNHPLYALKRHLLKFEAIYPSDAPTLGFVRGEAVYARECVHSLHSREVWVKEAKVVRPGEEPYKIVKARPKYDKMSGTLITDIPLQLFGSWQVGEYEPPVAENGVVPRNEYGNVELFKACMLPKGTVHLPIPGLLKVARKLGIDCAPAMIGFDYHCGGSHPTYDGYVVCEEHKDVLLDAWRVDVEESEKRAAEKREKRVYDNWKRIIKGLLIRERLKERYSFGASQASTSKVKSSAKANTRAKRNIK